MNETTDLHRNPDAAEDMAVNAVVSYLRGCGLTDQNEIGRWIKRVFDRVRAKVLIH
jgi:hypothetical protein